MTRFMMSIDDAVDLVLYAFQNGEPGDIFVQKAPAATIETLAIAVKQFPGAQSNSRSSGPGMGRSSLRHFLTREERAKAEDHGEYFRSRLTTGIWTIGLFLYRRAAEMATLEDFSSDNARLLDVAKWRIC